MKQISARETRLEKERDRLRDEIVALRGSTPHKDELMDTPLGENRRWKCTVCHRESVAPVHTYFESCPGPGTLGLDSEHLRLLEVMGPLIPSSVEYIAHNMSIAVATCLTMLTELEKRGMVRTGEFGGDSNMWGLDDEYFNRQRSK